MAGLYGYPYIPSKLLNINRSRLTAAPVY